MMAVNAAPGSSQPNAVPTMRRWALEEIGRNSVSPCTRPRTTASNQPMPLNPLPRSATEGAGGFADGTGGQGRPPEPAPPRGAPGPDGRPPGPAGAGRLAARGATRAGSQRPGGLAAGA